jgi:hypothetical protein
VSEIRERTFLGGSHPTSAFCVDGQFVRNNVRPSRRFRIRFSGAPVAQLDRASPSKRGSGVRKSPVASPSPLRAIDPFFRKSDVQRHTLIGIVLHSNWVLYLIELGAEESYTCPMTMVYETQETSPQVSGASEELGLRPWSCKKTASPIHAIAREAGLGSGDVTAELAVVRFHCVSVACASRGETPHLTAMESSWDDWRGLPTLLHDSFL